MKMLFYCLLFFFMQSTMTSEDIRLQNIFNLINNNNNIKISDSTSKQLSVLLFSPESNDKKMKLKLRKLPCQKLNEAKNNYSIVNGCFKKKQTSFTMNETTKNF